MILNHDEIEHYYCHSFDGYSVEIFLYSEILILYLFFEIFEFYIIWLKFTKLSENYIFFFLKDFSKFKKDKILKLFIKIKVLEIQLKRR